MNRRTQFLKEPLLHFLVIGAVLFGAYAWLNRDGGDAGVRQVHLAESDVRWLEETFVLQWQREPTQEELRALVRDLVKEQLLARQAQELGLGQDDIVVRRRLAQKMMLLLQDDSRRTAPSDDDLHRLYDARRSQAAGEPRTLLTRPRISFTHIFFSRDQRADAAADARQALRELSRPDAPAAALGDRVSIKPEFRNADERAVANQFGAKFAAQVFELAPGPWQGPIESTRGLHLVRITELVPAQLRPFDEIREELVELWHAQSQRESEERYFAGLLKKYQVVPDESVKGLVGPLIDLQEAGPKSVAPGGGAPKGSAP
jgi:parvulin-like peptidyl-prolyl isomerase